MRKTIATTAVALSAAALTLGAAGAAYAERYGVDDRRDSRHGSDIRALLVRYGTENLHVITTHENLRRNPTTGSAGVVYVDTDSSDRGPEYVLVGGYFAGTDYALVETEGFGHRRWGDRVERGDYAMTIRYGKDRVRATLSREALGDPTDVRVAVRASGRRSDGTHVVDWVGEPRSFTPWISPS